MFSKIKGYLDNNKGNAGLIYIVFTLIMTAIYMALGGVENNLSILTVNEIKDIMDINAPIAVKEGIDENALKNETIIENYTDQKGIKKAKETFAFNVATALEDASFSGRIITPRATIETSLLNNTRIKTGKGKWINSWNDSTKETEYVIITTSLPIELKNNIKVADNPASINREFTETNSSGGENKFTVECKIQKDGLGAFIYFESIIYLV